MTAVLPFPALAVDRAGEGSLHRQLYERIQDAIGDGRLPPGARLPSTRNLAAQLGVARGTVDAVYARLAGEGCLVSRRHSGTIVTPGLTLTPTPKPASPTRGPPPDPGWSPLQLGLPALDLFPRKTWTRIHARQARQLSAAEMLYPDPMGLPALREAIAAYLAVSRGITCAIDQIVVTHGFQDALNLTAELVLKPGDAVWTEDPGYGFAQRTLAARGMAITAVPVDDEGLRVDWGQAHAPDARLAVVTPTHQFPTGVPLSPRRRRALLDWATASDLWVLEDDYDCEFHYSGRKPAALKALDLRNRVFYAGSFSKTLLPSLRLGYLVLPSQWAQAAGAAQQLRHRGVAMFEQLAVAEFMRQGHFARHLRRMMLAYKARRAALVAALERRFGDRIEIVLRAGGLHVLARFPHADADDAELARRALEVGLKPSPLSGQCLSHDLGQGLLLSFTNVAEDRADDVAAALFRALR
ncbi:PLP-dependent aminotransferase family protein [Caulobacter sp. UNC279MFTsu5.1]|uniref:MocR-like pyridoxine biosynthesis transcription factor PdxR n=1 Tax=Caulobacter sp. UNC279MFTsu5.1 TaxID=1502775 RepID=UPI000B7D1A13|nr:PLP-dependent aminotransferase family protein [Caulobacter sp. UNC279MFTsu5.1]